MLVNTVGNFVYAPLAETTVADFDNILATNVRTLFTTTTILLPMLQQSTAGRIINFGAAGADQLTPRSQTAVYTAAKAAVISLSKSWATELASDRVTVNVISPGIVENSNPTPELPTDSPASFNDITRVITFLVQPDSHYITGANIEVAGGWTPSYRKG